MTQQEALVQGHIPDWPRHREGREHAVPRPVRAREVPVPLLHLLEETQLHLGGGLHSRPLVVLGNRVALELFLRQKGRRLVRIAERPY